MDDQSVNRPFFSVIMPVYNHGKYVAQSVRSVQRQTCGQWELIIVDDGSTDDSPRIINELASGDRRISVIHQPNMGPAAARNTALARARGGWLTYLDSDDVWLPDALESYAAYIRAHPQARFIYGYRHRLEEDGAITELGGEYQDHPTGTSELFARMYLSHLCVCYRREMVDLAGPYDASLRSCEDYELYLRMSLHCAFEPIGKPTGLRRRHGGNISRQTGYSRFLEAEVLRRFYDRHGSKTISPEQAQRRFGRLYYSAARQYFKARCFRKAIVAARRAAQYQKKPKCAIIGLLSRLLLPLTRDDGREMPAL
jgi:glycosyltransferase involved in cell wall biosynthesis